MGIRKYSPGEKEQLCAKFSKILKQVAEEERAKQGLYLLPFVVNYLEIQWNSFSVYTRGVKLPTAPTYYRLAHKLPKLLELERELFPEYAAGGGTPFIEELKRALKEYFVADALNSMAKFGRQLDPSIPATMLLTWLRNGVRPSRKSLESLASKYPVFNKVNPFQVQPKTPPQQPPKTTGVPVNKTGRPTQGSVLVALRKKYCHSRKSLCDLVGIPIAAMSRYENNLELMPVEHKRALEYTYGIKVQYPVQAFTPEIEPKPPIEKPPIEKPPKTVATSGYAHTTLSTDYQTTPKLLTDGDTLPPLVTVTPHTCLLYTSPSPRDS